MLPRFGFLTAALGLAAGAATLSGAVVGTNVQPTGLSAESISKLDTKEKAAWEAYRLRSDRLRAADQAKLAAEFKAAGLTAALVPAKAPNAAAPTADFWASEAAATQADNIVSFQTPAGGWSKNTDFTKAARRPGERYGTETGYDGTIDNGGTTQPLRFLAQAITAHGAGKPRAAAWETAFQRGVEYLLAAQYPNGGWPQVFPLVGSYHDAITFNDDAIIGVLTLLREIAAGSAPFAFTAPELRARANAATDKGLELILATQVVTDGRRTVWGQQHDPLTLAPCAARAFEMTALASGESASITRYLIALPDPSPAVVTAVHAAAAWFQKTMLRDVIYKPAPDGSGRQLQPSPGAGPIWPRFSHIGTDRPLFGDRDLTIHDDVSEISKERRNGYAWFGDGPKRTLDHYERWAKKQAKGK